jgi:hypothetical protein
VPGPTPRRSLVLLALPLALLAGACGDDDDDAAETTTTATTAAEEDTTTTAAEEEDTTTTATTAAPEPAGNVVEVEVVGGQPVGGAVAASVPVGEEVTIRVTSDVEDEVHVHGYDLTADVAPGAPAALTFVADIPGQFEVELEGSHVLIVDLTVS